MHAHARTHMHSQMGLAESFYCTGVAKSSTYLKRHTELWISATLWAGFRHGHIKPRAKKLHSSSGMLLASHCLLLSCQSFYHRRGPSISLVLGTARSSTSAVRRLGAPVVGPHTRTGAAAMGGGGRDSLARRVCFVRRRGRRGPAARGCPCCCAARQQYGNTLLILASINGQRRAPGRGGGAHRQQGSHQVWHRGRE